MNPMYAAYAPQSRRYTPSYVRQNAYNPVAQASAILENTLETMEEPRKGLFSSVGGFLKKAVLAVLAFIAVRKVIGLIGGKGGSESGGFLSNLLSRFTGSKGAQNGLDVTA